MAASVDWLAVGGPVEPWLALELVSTGVDTTVAINVNQRDGCRLIPLFGTGIEVDSTARPGLRRLVMSGVDPQVTSIDGVTIEVRDESAPVWAAHPCGAQSIDHVVIVTDDLARTCGAIADVTGAPLKRVREAGEMRQGFHRIGGLIVEVVERAGLPAGPAALWGFVLVVDDLAGVGDRLGADLISPLRDAVQPGRSIATVSEAAGLGVPLALMSPDPR